MAESARGQDEASPLLISTCNYLPRWARWIYLSLVDPTKKLFFGHVMNPSLTKRVSVSKAEYWPRSLLRFYCS